jgi:hypothetical protein
MEKPSSSYQTGPSRQAEKLPADLPRPDAGAALSAVHARAAGYCSS